MSDLPLMLPPPSGRMVPLNELAANTQTEIQQSQNWHGAEFREAIKESLNYLLKRAKNDEIPNRSQVQSGDVADMVDHIQSELQPMYSVDELVKFLPEGPQDDEASDTETRATNWYFKERMRGFEKVDTAIQDAILSRNGYLKVWYEESFGLPYEQEYEGEPEQIDGTIAELEEENKVEVVEETVLQEQVIDVAIAYDTDGITEIDVPVELQPEIRRVKLFIIPVIREVKSEAIAGEDMFVSRDAMDTDMQRMRFCAHRRRIMRQECTGLGLDPEQVKRMPAVATYDSDVRTARKEDFNTYTRYAADPGGELVDLFHCHYLIDRDGDGIQELWEYYYSSNQEILDWAPKEGEEEGQSTAQMVRVRPYACGTILKVAHRHQGRSIYDKEKEIEDIKRALLRQMLDNIYLGNDQRSVVGPGVNLDDMDEIEIGGYVRAQDVGQVQAFPHIDTAPTSLAALQYMDKMRKERAGTSIDLSSENLPIRQGGDHTTERIMSAMEKQLGMYARNMANTLIRDTFVLLHQQLRLLPGKMAFEVDDAWAETEPRLWVDRTRLSVTLGMSEGERLRYIGALSNSIQVQNADEERGAGGVLTNAKSQYEARVDLYRAQGLKNPEQYAVNPESEEAQAAMQAKQQLAQQQQQLQMQMFEQQQAALLAVTQMQEMTKRMDNRADQIEKQRDRVASMIQHAEKLIAKYAEMAIQAGLSPDGLDEALEEGLEGGEIVQLSR